MALTDNVLKTLKPTDRQYKRADGDGLFILVKPNGRKYWRLQYRKDNKHKTFAIGVYPAISLKEARRRKDDARSLIAQNVDPVAARQLDRAVQAEREADSSVNTLEAVAREWLAMKSTEWAPTHARRQVRRLEKLSLIHI